jgi:hypothetical protein
MLVRNEGILQTWDDFESLRSSTKHTTILKNPLDRICPESTGELDIGT